MSLERLLKMQATTKANQKPNEIAGGETRAVGKQESGLPAAPRKETPTPAPTEQADSAETPTPTKPKASGLANIMGGKPQTKAQAAKLEKPPVESLTLDNLGSFDLSLIDESEPDEVSQDDVTGSGFIDEIEATAPDRELPQDLTDQQAGFVSLLDSVYDILNDSEMFAQQIRTIMMEMQENPEYIKLISDVDVHVMIRAMRNTMGLAKIRKQSKKRTSGTASSRARKPSKKQALMDKALNLSIGMDIDL